ncbi:hypothetical protein F0562_017679 [Nyssa sinensis]|uniref:Uncharacterized protein n=1 Tax=Nyssa sinensis TaxID=561372 RepID=A0A5J4ZIH1_9ASTE|nr:hypothetical protein F0562_017679 [Nyssa sinensis]
MDSLVGVGLLVELVALALGAHYHFGRLEVIDLERDEAATDLEHARVVGSKLSKAAIGSELAEAVASSELAIATAEFVRLELVESKPNFSQFGLESRYAVPWSTSPCEMNSGTP